MESVISFVWEREKRERNSYLTGRMPFFPALSLLFVLFPIITPKEVKGRNWAI